MNSLATLTEPPAIQPMTAIDTARQLAASFAARAATHDADDSFVADNYADLKAAGLMQVGVPVDLGGGGAELPDLCAMLRVIAAACPSTGLAFAMHTHQVAIPAWRWTHRPAMRPAVEPLLRRIAAERLTLVSSGGSDWVGGSGQAEKVDGGYRITARKIFSSGSPAGDLLVTGAVSEEADGRKVVHFAVPLASPQVKVLDTWRTLGMRGTGSNDVEITGFFVPDDKIALKRPAGEWHPGFQIIATVAFPLIYAAYLGVAEGARDLALTLARKRPLSPRSLHLAGEMDTRLNAARAAHQSMLDAAMAHDPSAYSVNLVMMGRRLVEEAAIRTVELAMELAGGAGFYRDAGLERRFRDIQAARYHPMPRETQYEYAGALAFGLPVDRIF